jgi:hypothetical protein
VQNLLPSRLLSKNLKITTYRTIILPVVWYGCETWSLTLREERRLRVFENRVLRRVYCAGGKIETNEMGRASGAYGGGWVHRLLVGKPEGKRPLGRPRRRWEDNIKIDLQEVSWEGTDWIDLAQERDRWRELLNAVMNLRVP